MRAGRVKVLLRNSTSMFAKRTGAVRTLKSWQTNRSDRRSSFGTQAKKPSRVRSVHQNRRKADPDDIRIDHSDQAAVSNRVLGSSSAITLSMNTRKPSCTFVSQLRSTRRFEKFICFSNGESTIGLQKYT